MNWRFIKYSSLGNDFILFDDTACPDEQRIASAEWQSFVIKLCDRHRGIGADGVLILKTTPLHIPEMLIFNADGSQAEISLNGMRCCVHHLYLQNSSHSIAIKAGKQTVENQVVSVDNSLEIKTCLASPVYERPLSLETLDRRWKGHCINVGNPHFVIFEKNDWSWLSQHGGHLESHPQFPQKTNVEFVWQEEEDPPLTYQVLVYERGCGMTLSCGSGAAAITKVLHRLGMVQAEQRVNLVMKGGLMECSLSAEGQVSVLGSADRLFWGELAELRHTN